MVKIEDHDIESLFKAKAKELEEAKGEKYDYRAVDWVWRKLTTYSFHARSNVEWNKYRAAKTDRTAGKEKKMGTREVLKGGSSSKEKPEECDEGECTGKLMSATDEGDDPPSDDETLHNDELLAMMVSP